MKYPRTYHANFSPGAPAESDAKILTKEELSSFVGRNLVITEKMDGSSLGCNKNFIHARSVNGPPTHPSFDWVKAHWSKNLKWYMLEADNATYFFEYCYAVHSIEYDAIPDYLFLIGIRDNRYGEWDWWDQVERQADELEVQTVPVIERNFQPKSIEELQSKVLSLMTTEGLYGPREGICVRVEDLFKDEDFKTSIFKCVRANHVNTGTHWTQQEIRKQRLISDL